VKKKVFDEKFNFFLILKWIDDGREREKKVKIQDPKKRTFLGGKNESFWYLILYTLKADFCLLTKNSTHQPTFECALKSITLTLRPFCNQSFQSTEKHFFFPYFHPFILYPHHAHLFHILSLKRLTHKKTT
jgi:hypothetical protein